MLAAALALALSAAPAWGVASGLDKLRPGDPVPTGRAADLAAARGECESFQVAVRAREPIAALGFEAGALVQGSSSPPVHSGRAAAGAVARVPLSLSRVAWLDLALPSGPDGAAGRWPDPLVPARDPDFGEARRAFPVALAAGELAVAWIDACVPADAPPGRYAGRVRILDGARRVGEVPVALHAWPFALPRRPGFTAAFGISTRTGTSALGAPGDPALARALAAVAIRHRVTPFSLSADPPDGTCTARACDLDWRRYDAEVGPVLDGALPGPAGAPGIAGGFAEVRIPGTVWSGPEADLAATLSAWAAHFEARGWRDRLWLYTLDEPRPDQLPELARRARLARAAGIRVFVTSEPQPALAGLVDAFVPNLARLPEPGEGERPGRTRFSYASCLSHGCGEPPAAAGARRNEFAREFSGWPGYEIDRPGTAARAVAWLGWRRGLQGELYYDMVQAWRGAPGEPGADPWRDVRRFSGNGDGTLLYPGRPEALGGRHPFPVPSIRLAIIRDAMEDVALLDLAREHGLAREAREAAARLVPSARGWERRPGPWLAARRALGDALAARLGEARPGVP